MANITINKIEPLTKEYYKIFSGVYEDFRSHAFKDYKFELEPLSYDDFISSVEEGLLDCLILLEENIPTGFLVSTTLISESLELNIIHCVGSQNIQARRKRLLEKFLINNSEIIKETAVTYPMLGIQDSFVPEIQQMGFKIVPQNVMRFVLTNPQCLKKITEAVPFDLEMGYSVSNYEEKYYDDIISVVYNSFKDTNDALFDPRFCNYEGCKDVVNKIVDSVYGKFLEDCTKIILYNDVPIGVCFVNVTGLDIGNIPLVAIDRQHRNKKLGIRILKAAVLSAVNKAINSGLTLSEINVTCDTLNLSAVKMYKAVGFIDDYAYAQAYRPKGEF